MLRPGSGGRVPIDPILYSYSNRNEGKRFHSTSCPANATCVGEMSGSRTAFTSFTRNALLDKNS
jgi:hypothetical protein